MYTLNYLNEKNLNFFNDSACNHHIMPPFKNLSPFMYNDGMDILPHGILASLTILYVSIESIKHVLGKTLLTVDMVKMIF